MHAVFMGMPTRLAKAEMVMRRCRETHDLSQCWHDRDWQTANVAIAFACNELIHSCSGAAAFNTRS